MSISSKPEAIVAGVQPLLEGVKILSPTVFALGDEAPIDWQRTGFYKADSSSLTETLIAALQGHLYNVAYMQNWPPVKDISDQADQVAGTASPSLTEQLLKLRPERLMSNGWSIAEMHNDQSATLTKRNWIRHAKAGEWGVSGQMQKKAIAWVRQPQPQLDSSRSFFYVYGSTLGDGIEQGNLFRIYFHTNEHTAYEVVRYLVTQLDAYHVPFILKTLASPASSKRSDATILYLNKTYHHHALRIISQLSKEWLDQLGPETPLFTLRLCDGIALAEDPVSGESFGMHRLRLVAESIVHCWQVSITDPDARCRNLSERFANEGLRLGTPHLGQGSTIDYMACWQSILGESRVTLSRESAPKPHETKSPYLDVAHQIGMDLCRDALWHEDRCTWQGYSVIERGGGYPVVWRTFGPDLYRGTSGIALFLAQLYRHVECPTLRRTMLGALRQALESLDQIEPLNRLGAYTGIPGVAYAAIQTGTLLGESEWIDRGVDALQSTRGIKLQNAMFDVVSGVAGSIPIFIAAAESYEQPDLLDQAVTYGNWLIEIARKEEGTYAWSGSEGSRPLCGYSHGASGVSLALAELYASTQEAHFADAALGGLAFEREYFEANSANWHDLRREPSQQKGQASMAWCHGSPGIGLARLRIAELLPQSSDMDVELNAAITSTAAQFSLPHHIPLNNFSLCHGACGNAELLLLAADQLDQPELEQQVRSIADLGISQIVENDLEWPSGLPNWASTPGLMLGNAGVGYFYLRVFDPDQTPSALCIHPEFYHSKTP